MCAVRVYARIAGTACIPSLFTITAAALIGCNCTRHGRMVERACYLHHITLIVKTPKLKLNTSELNLGMPDLFIFNLAPVDELFLTAVCRYRYVITLGLWSKYNVVDHYSSFAARILANPWDYALYDVTLLLLRIVCNHLIQWWFNVIRDFQTISNLPFETVSGPTSHYKCSTFNSHFFAQLLFYYKYYK